MSNLQNQKIIFLRNVSDNWDRFSNQDGVHALPKYTMYNMVPEGKVGTEIDYRVIPTLRNKNHRKEASRWATHFVAISQFLEQKEADYLFVCEDSIELQESQIKQIEQSLKTPGLTILSEDASAYTMDKAAAKIIQQNAYIYYNTWQNILRDIKTLNLIEVKEDLILKKSTKPFIDFELLIIGLFTLLLLLIADDI